MGWSRGNKWRERVFAGGRDAKWEKNRGDELECEDCGKVCKSKGGLTNHRQCDICKGAFSPEANLLNHLRICEGGMAGERRPCGMCERYYSRKYLKRHMRECAARRGVLLSTSAPPPPAPEDQARVYKSKRRDCQICGRNVAATNYARHQRTEWCQRTQRA